MSIPTEVREEALRARGTVVRRAREDPATFAQYVLRHERTGRGITLAPCHAEWHDLMTRHKRLIIWSSVELGKTQQVSIARPLYELGCDPSKRIVIVGNSHGAAVKIVRTIGQYIRGSQRLRHVFPNLKPAAPWTQTSLTVERPVYSKDPSVQALGTHGDVIGSRIDDLFLDDVLDYENTRTVEQRLELRQWFLSSMVGRLTAQSRVWIVGNAFYKDDLLHWLADERGYLWRRYPVANDEGEPIFRQEWTRERIEAKEEELGGKGSPECDRQLYCKARSDESSRCKEEWIERCLARGVGMRPRTKLTEEKIAELSTPDKPATAHTGVDLGVKKHRKAAKSVVFNLLAHPDGSREVMQVRSGRWGAAEIMRNTLAAQKSFNSTAHVEDNGAQDFLLQFMRGDGFEGIGDPAAHLFVLPFHTGGNKTNPVIGIESVFAELARGLWIIPSIRLPSGKLVGATPEIREWIAECLAYTPDTHTGDHLMASWFAREGARLQGRKRGEIGARIIGEDVTDSDKVAAEYVAARAAAAGVAERSHGDAPRPPAKVTPLRPELEGWEALLRRDRR